MAPCEVSKIKKGRRGRLGIYDVSKAVKALLVRARYPKTHIAIWRHGAMASWRLIKARHSVMMRL
jgi:hypothetical protein